LATLASSNLDAADGGWTSGGGAEVIRNGYARVRTNSYGANGDVALLGSDLINARTIWQVDTLKTSGVSHVAFAESGDAENSTPIFTPLDIPDNSTTVYDGPYEGAWTYLDRIDYSVIMTALKTLPQDIGV
jgi:hypothetical protein